MSYRPALSDFSAVQFLFGYIKYLGPVWFRRILADIVPIRKVNRLKASVTKIEQESRKILADKRAALEAGDQKVLEQVGQGKDIMSILSEFSSLLYLEDIIFTSK